MSMPAPEVWKPIPQSLYEISSLGRVRRATTGGLLKPRDNGNGYLKVYLGTQREEYIHRLVCAVFHGPAPSADCHADHINAVRSDNRLLNLRWATPEANRASRNFAQGERSGQSKLTEECVRHIIKNGTSHSTDKQMAEELGVSREQVRDIRRGKSWRHIHAAQ